MLPLCTAKHLAKRSAIEQSGCSANREWTCTLQCTGVALLLVIDNSAAHARACQASAGYSNLPSCTAAGRLLPCSTARA